jgi:hypothetical protein
VSGWSPSKGAKAVVSSGRKGWQNGPLRRLAQPERSDAAHRALGRARRCGCGGRARRCVHGHAHSVAQLLAGSAFGAVQRRQGRQRQRRSRVALVQDTVHRRRAVNAAKGVSAPARTQRQRQLNRLELFPPGGATRYDVRAHGKHHVPSRRYVLVAGQLQHRHGRCKTSFGDKQASSHVSAARSLLPLSPFETSAKRSCSSYGERRSRSASPARAGPCAGRPHPQPPC